MLPAYTSRKYSLLWGIEGGVGEGGHARERREGGRGIVRGNGMSVEECQGSGMVFDSVQYGHSSMGRTESHCTVKTPSAMMWQRLMLRR